MPNRIRYLLYLILKPIYLIIFKIYIPHFKNDFDGHYILSIRELPGGEERWSGTERRKERLGNTHPWNRYFYKPLSTKPKNIYDIVRFLRGCKYISDRHTRSRNDFWEPPDIFEKRRTGDCEDHAIWAWRQLYDIGYRTRFVLGICGNCEHAWVHIFVNGRCYLLESTQKHGWFPVISDYKPSWSVENGPGKKFLFFEHQVTNQRNREKKH